MEHMDSIAVSLFIVSLVLTLTNLRQAGLLGSMMQTQSDIMVSSSLLCYFHKDKDEDSRDKIKMKTQSDKMV